MAEFVDVFDQPKRSGGAATPALPPPGGTPVDLSAAAPSGGGAAGFVDVFDDPRFTQSMTAASPATASRLANNKWDMLKSRTVDSPDQSAGFGATIKAGIPPDVAGKIQFFAKARGIEPNRYGVDKEGNIGFLNDNGEFVREIPTLGKSTGPIDFLRRFGQRVGFELPGAAPQVAATMVGGAMGPTGLSIPAAAVTAGATDVGRQALGNYLLDRSIMDIDPGSVAAQAGTAGLAQGVTYGVGKLANRNPLQASYKDVRSLRDPAKAANVERLASDAQSRGITLTPGEASGAKSLLQKERQIGRYDEAATTMDDFYRQRSQQQVPRAVQDVLDGISPQPAPVGARQLQGGAREVAADIKREANKAAGPFYDIALDNQAMVSGPGKKLNERLAQFVDDPITQQAINEGVVIQRLEHVASGKNTPFDPKAYGVTRDQATGQYVLEGAPNMRTLNVLKKGLDNIIEGYRDKASGVLALDEKGRAIEMFRKSFVKALDDANPDYRVARAIYAAKIEPIDEVKGGIIGLISRDRAGNFTAVPETMFGKGMSDPIAAYRNRKLFEKADQMDAWNAGLRSFLETRFTEAAARSAENAGGSFYRNIFANPNQVSTLKAAMGGQGNPQWQAFDGLMRNLQALTRQAREGSPTATDLGGKAGFAGPVAKTGAAVLELGSPLNVASRAATWLREASGGRNMGKIADLITGPDAIKELRKLRVMSPGSEKALTLIDNVLVNSGAYAARPEAPEQMPPVLAAP